MKNWWKKNNNREDEVLGEEFSHLSKLVCAPLCYLIKMVYRYYCLTTIIHLNISWIIKANHVNVVQYLHWGAYAYKKNHKLDRFTKGFQVRLRTEHGSSWGGGHSSLSMCLSLCFLNWVIVGVAEPKRRPLQRKARAATPATHGSDQHLTMAARPDDEPWRPDRQLNRHLEACRRSCDPWSCSPCL